MSGSSKIFDRMSALADPLRSRLLLLLEQHELTVGEVCAVVQLPQSTVSRHLKVLVDDGWIVSHAEGTSRRYRMLSDAVDPAAKRLWHLVREQVSSLPSAEQDAQRLRTVLARRRTRSQEFFSSAALEWDHLRAEMFGQRADLQALLGLLDDDLVVGDLGCGTGPVSDALAPFVGRIVAVDDSAAMLAAARHRLADRPNVEIRKGDMAGLPLGDAELDAAVTFLVLHHVAEPAAAFAEIARVLRPGGRLLIVDMTPHDRAEYRQRMGHIWLGFSERQLQDWLGGDVWTRVRYTVLAPDQQAKGPGLFVASARRSSSVEARAQGRSSGTLTVARTA